MKNARWWRVLALTGILALVVAACGGDGGAEFEPGDLSGQSIEVAAKWGEDTGEAEAFAQVIDLFEQETGATVTYTSMGDDLPTVLAGRVAGGDPPDVAILPQPGLLRDFAGQDALISIEERVGDEVDANFAPVWRELGSVDGTLYGVWFKAANKSTFWYNLGVFESAGVEPPSTWEELTTVAQTIADSGVAPYAIDGASGWVLSDWFENIYLRTAGPEMYDQLTDHDIPWTDPSVKEALTTFADIIGTEANLAGGVDATLQSEFPTSVTVAFGDPPDAGMVYEGDFVGGVITTETASSLGTDADFFDFPAIEDSPASIVGGGDVVVLMQETEAGQAFLEYLATPQSAEVWAALGGFSSPNQALDTSVYPDEISARSAEALANAETFRFDMSDLQPAAFGSTAGQGIWGLLQEFVRNPSDIDGIAQKLEDEATTAFGS